MINRIFSKIYSLFEYKEIEEKRTFSFERINELERRYITILRKNEVITIRRRAMFWAQLAHESNLFPTAENMNYSASRLLAIFPRHFNPVNVLRYARKPEMIANRVYANRMGNGPESSGDGWKHRGHGLIQDTGKARHIELTNFMKVDIVGNPSLLLVEANAMVAALQFWTKHKLNDYADFGDLKKITRIINGGLNGLEDRQNKYIIIYEYLIKIK